MASAERVTVTLPNLAVYFLSNPPEVNENYDAAYHASRAWLIQQCDFDERGKKTVVKGDFTYFCADAVPIAGLERYRLFCDWVNWVFPFDDFFDNGKLKDDP